MAWLPRFASGLLLQTSGESPAKEESNGKQEASRDDSHRTLRIAIGLFAGYGYYNTMRGTFPLQMKSVARDLDIPMDRIGMPTSIFSACYGLAKFFGSVATDYLPCAECHALGVFLCGLDVAAMSLCTGLSGFVWLWGLQGMLQAFGWPFLARIVVTELPESKRAKYWGALSMAGNVGALLTPYGMVLAANAGLTWRGSFLVAGASAAAMSVLVWWLLCCGHQNGTNGAAASRAKESKKSASGSPILSVLRNPVLLVLMLTNALSYFSSKTAKEWGAIYLRGTGLAGSDMQVANLLFWAEIGGSCGAFLSGYISASVLGGRHALTCTLSASIAAGALGTLTWFSHASASSGATPMPFAAACGFQALAMLGTNGVRTLAGLHAAEVAARSGILGMANGWMEIVGQMGSVMAGQPLGALAVYVSGAAGSDRSDVTRDGWVSILGVLAAASAGMAVLNFLLLPQEARRLGQAAADTKKTD